MLEALAVLSKEIKAVRDRPLIPGPQGPPGPPGKDGLPGREADNSAFEARIAAIEKELAALKGVSAEQAKNADLILYYTSQDAGGSIAAVDKKIDELKARGWPIVVTRLSPTDASVQGVPLLFMPFKNQKVAGVSNCLTHLALLIR